MSGSRVPSRASGWAGFGLWKPFTRGWRTASDSRSTVVQVAAVLGAFLIIAVFVGPENIVAMDTLFALLVGTVLYRVIKPGVLAAATTLMIGTGCLWAVVQNSGLLAQQPPLGSSALSGITSAGSQTTFSLFGLSADDLTNATLAVAFEALCLLLVVRAIEWWKARPASGRESGQAPSTRPQVAGLVFRLAVCLVAGAYVYVWTGSAVQSLLALTILGLALARVVDSGLFAIAGVVQIMCCALLLTVENSGLLGEWQDGVAYLAAHGVTTFEPICTQIGLYAAVLLLAGALGYSSDASGTPGGRAMDPASD